MKMIVFMFIYCFITSNSYIRCSTVQYTTNSTVNETLIIVTEEGPKATMKRRCVVPGSELKDLLQSECFVDKSLIVKDFLNMESHFACVTAPRLFGKTVNLKMLKAFLEVENGHITSNLTDNCRLFRKYNLNIFTWNNTFFHLHCGKYPVIYINFKKIKGNSFNDIFHAFRELLLDSYLEHVYLQNSARLKVREKFFISKYIKFYSNKTFTDSTRRILLDGFAYLTEMLYYHFNKKSIVLIDEFDAWVWLLLSRDYQGNYFPFQDISKTMSLIEQFMHHFFENNRYIGRGLINNCFQLSSIFLTKTNCFVHFRFLKNHPLVKYYGLTENEVREKLNHFNILHTHEDVKHYYNGYKIQGSGDNIYNTWSVMNYLQTERLEDYWIATAGLHNFSGIFLKKEVRKLIYRLLGSGNITIEITEIVTRTDILNLRETMVPKGECVFLTAEEFLLFLSDIGCLNRLSTNKYLVSLSIPNNEIFQHFYKQYVPSCSI